MNTSNNLLEDVKNYLDITFTDQKSDEKLMGIIDRGIRYLENRAGNEIDFLPETIERQLLFDLCRYIRSNNLEEFEQNFASELIALRIRNEVKDYAEQQTV